MTYFVEGVMEGLGLRDNYYSGSRCVVYDFPFKVTYFILHTRLTVCHQTVPGCRAPVSQLSWCVWDSVSLSPPWAKIMQIDCHRFITLTLLGQSCTFPAHPPCQISPPCFSSLSLLSSLLLILNTPTLPVFPHTIPCLPPPPYHSYAPSTFTLPTILPLFPPTDHSYLRCIASLPPLTYLLLLMTHILPAPPP